MVGANLKAETMKFMEQRIGLEVEMNVIIERLTQPGGPGLSGNLVDSEGFPRSDIDISSVRADRHRLSVLRNDHRDITEKINQNIQVLHSARLTSTTAKEIGDTGSPGLAPSAVSVPASGLNFDVVVSRPFAMVDEISEASPAAEDGLQLGDQVLKFGNVESGENLLQRLATEVQSNQGLPVPMVILRQGDKVNLTVMPRAWQGRGLMGCHFQII